MNCVFVHSLIIYSSFFPHFLLPHNVVLLCGFRSDSVSLHQPANMHPLTRFSLSQSWSRSLLKVFMLHSCPEYLARGSIPGSFWPTHAVPPVPCRNESHVSTPSLILSLTYSFSSVLSALLTFHLSLFLSKCLLTFTKQNTHPHMIQNEKGWIQLFLKVICPTSINS